MAHVSSVRLLCYEALLKHSKGCGSKLGARNLERGNGYSLFHLAMIKEGMICCTGSHWQGHLKEMRRPWQALLRKL